MLYARSEGTITTTRNRKQPVKVISTAAALISNWLQKCHVFDRLRRRYLYYTQIRLLVVQIRAAQANGDSYSPLSDNLVPATNLSTDIRIGI